MGSVTEPRHCANGERCVGYDTPSRKAQKLGRYNNEDVCEACQREEAVRHEEVPPEHAELFRVARLLFSAGVEKDETDIIPTLVFAANLAGMPKLRSIRDGLAALDEGGEVWRDMYAQVSSTFDGFVIPVGTKEGAPILRLASWRMILVSPEQEGIEEVCIDVFDRSVQPHEVAAKYEHYLKIRNVNVDPIRGTISYKVYADFVRIVVRPETTSVDRADGRILPVDLRAGWPGFPDPLIVAGMCEVLRGSETKGKFKGFKSVMAGRERGRGPGADTLILGCVAWYVAGRRKRAEGTEERRRVVRILNQELLEPCGKEPLSDKGNSSSTLWRSIGSVSDAIERLELALQGRRPPF